MFWVLLFLVVVTAVTLFHLRGPDLRQFDAPLGQRFPGAPVPSEEHDAVVASLAVSSGTLAKASRRERLGLMREYMDNMANGLDLAASITPVVAGGVPAEWVIAPGADPQRRVLYIHGGAFMMGSPRSHRNITNRFSEVSGAAVLAIDYRLMPEHRRMAGIEDCRKAYTWILENGPAGPGVASKVYVAGDSAGGNLTLSLIAWLRDEGLRAPDAAVAFSPATDSTFASPTILRNMDSDAMLGPMFRDLAKIPAPLLWWFGWFQNRIAPSNPLVSPLFADLAGLPPTLLQASEAEILYGDSVRYVNRAVAAGSMARLQSWPHMVHVWQMFYPQLTEAREAWDEVGKFIAEVDMNGDRESAGGVHSVKQLQGTFGGARGHLIHYQYWIPETAPRALLLLVHGAGEHCDRYQRLAGFFAAQGYAIAALDHPGHGRSEGRYGHVDRFDDYISTLEIFQRRVTAEFAGLPQILVGHSMGGLISSIYLLQHQQDFCGCVLSGPAIQTDIEPGFFQLSLIRFLSVVAPGAGVLQLDANGVSRDPEVVADYVKDPLINHSKMTARMVAELFAGMRQIQAEANRITLPLLLLHGGEDVMAAPAGSRFLHENVRSSDKTLKIYPGLYHEIFNEPEQETVFADMLDWCNRHVATG